LRAHQKGLEIAYSIEGDVPVTVVGDPGRLRQALVNLLANAVKFTERGEVLVSVLLVSQCEHELKLHFSVADSGIGIPPEKHSLIFEAFAQADSSTTRNYGGSGLGLAICARLVGIMGGRIWVNSTVGQGSTFHFTARFEAATGTQAAVVPCIRSELLHVPVIVVDDNATNRMIVTEMTESWGMAVVAAEGGESALATMRRAYAGGNGLRLAIIDGQMPGMSGFELAEQIRQDPQLASAMIMMLTSTDQSGDAARCRQLGIAAYLVKPIRKSELLSAILSTLGTSALPSPTRHPARKVPNPGKRGLRILLVEDNPVNQTVGLRMLEKMGHATALANNGKEALARIAQEKFELVLMDVQMPEMDGLTATQHIRELEKKTGGHLPIVAMTARAMRGDREECLTAGMDGYISKPIAPEELEAALLQHADSAGRSLPVHEATPSDPAPVAEGWDAHKFLEKLGGDKNLLREITDIFLDETPKLIARLQQAIQAGNAELVETTAHSLKGGLSYFGSAGTNQARELERMGREKNLTEAAGVLTAFLNEVNALMNRVRQEMRGKGAHAG
jgi:CheY-like chemotaxis protein